MEEKDLTQKQTEAHQAASCDPWTLVAQAREDSLKGKSNSPFVSEVISRFESLGRIAQGSSAPVGGERGSY